MNPGFRTDKIEHGYLPAYLAIAADLQQRAGSRHLWVLEIGVRDGTSLTMWQHLFPHATIAGVDNSPTCAWPADTLRIIADQTHPALAGIVETATANNLWDLIVDDASHLGEATAATFAQLWNRVRPGGYYVIEDWYVGGYEWPSYDRSMLFLAESLLGRLLFQGDPAHIESITYRYGMIILRKAPE